MSYQQKRTAVIFNKQTGMALNYSTLTLLQKDHTDISIHKIWKHTKEKGKFENDTFIIWLLEIKR